MIETVSDESIELLSLSIVLSLWPHRFNFPTLEIMTVFAIETVSELGLIRLTKSESKRQYYRMKWTRGRSDATDFSVKFSAKINE
jgi:hypothetical protein